MKTVEILRSKADHSVLAVSINDVRHGPDAGPWDVIGRWNLRKDCGVDVSSDPQPDGGEKFEAVKLEPAGWTVLAPWVRVDGKWLRPHVGGFTTDWQSKDLAEELNAARPEAKESACSVCHEVPCWCEGPPSAKEPRGKEYTQTIDELIDGPGKRDRRLEPPPRGDGAAWALESSHVSVHAPSNYTQGSWVTTTVAIWSRDR